MKKIIIVYAVLIVAVLLLAIVKAGGKLEFSNPFKGAATAQINKTTVNLMVARSTQEKIKGLSGRSKLEPNQGMLFIFDKKGVYPFWMKEMKFPLDLIYINDNSVSDIIENAPVPQSPTNLAIYKPSSPANYVLEVNAGFSKKNNIKKGDKVSFKGL